MFWVREGVTREICQYLNSGFPAVVRRGDHTVVIVGYLRNADFTEFPPDESESSVRAFVVADDQRGPFDFLNVHDLVREVMAGDAAVFIPLPPGLWVSGSAAEERGGLHFYEALGNLVADALSEEEKTETETVSIDQEHLDSLQESLAACQASDGSSDVSVRSYAITSSDFKRGFQSLYGDLDPKAAQIVRMAAMPKFVWVVEVMRRSLRVDGKPSVIGLVVLDATDVDERDQKVSLVRLPGLIRLETGGWQVTDSTEAIASGRYHATKPWHSDPVAVTARAKYATGR
ncbi:MAG: hypothetical protein K8R99_05855 [Actinomycetia bacterium]|nr:hypothetical protein [Actinomycetes bacterium]